MQGQAILGAHNPHMLRRATSSGDIKMTERQAGHRTQRRRGCRSLREIPESARGSPGDE